MDLYPHCTTYVHWTYHVAVFRIGGALLSLPYMCPKKLSRGCFENSWSSTRLPYMCPLNLSRGCLENLWSSTSTPLHVSNELFTWLGRENVELNPLSPTFVDWTYHVAVLRIGGALPPLPYTCPLTLSHGCVENKLTSTPTPLHVSTELITWLCWEEV